MPRFIDRLLAAKRWEVPNLGLPQWYRESDEDLGQRVSEVYQRLKRSTVLEIENVAKYYFTHHADRDGRLDEPESFPNLAPPFESAFYEYTLRPWMGDILLGSDGDRLAQEIGQVGVLMWAEDVDEVFRESDQPRTVLTGHSVSHEPPRWLVAGVIFISHNRPKVVYGPSALMVYAVSEDGQVTDPVRNRAWGIRHDMFAHLPEETEWRTNLFTSCSFPASLATSFLHCKNVVTEENEPPPKLSKAFRRRHGRPLVSFKTLSIQPLSHKTRRPPSSASTGIEHPLHICRGHFKDYRNSNGLFGKLKGLFWWDMHARGKAEQGAVIKDYAIKLPE